MKLLTFFLWQNSKTCFEATLRLRPPKDANESTVSVRSDSGIEGSGAGAVEAEFRHQLTKFLAECRTGRLCALLAQYRSSVGQKLYALRTLNVNVTHPCEVAGPVHALAAVAFHLMPTGLSKGSLKLIISHTAFQKLPTFHSG